MIVHVILCLNEREWFRKRKRKRLINQEDQVSELTFNFHGALSILTFFENEFTLFTKEKQKKNKEKKERRKEKNEERKNRGEMRRKKRKEKKEKNFLFKPTCQKSQF